MSLTEIIGASASTPLFFMVVGLLLLWLFIYSAVKSGVKSALEEVLRIRDGKQLISEDEEFEKEMKGWE